MMISPARTLAVIILMHTPKSTSTALGYVGGMVSAMVVQGAGLGAAMSLVGDGAGSWARRGHEPRRWWCKEPDSARP